MRRIILSIYLLACGAAQAGQFLTNPGFETGSLTPWTNDTRYGTGVNWAITSTGCHSGSYCAVDTGNIGLEQTFSPVADSTITDISFWALHPNSGVTALAVDLFYVWWRRRRVHSRYVRAPAGTSSTYFADLRPTGSLDGIEIFGNTGGVSMADDFSITASTATTPEPATFGLFFVRGLATMAMAARRRRLFKQNPDPGYPNTSSGCNAHLAFSMRMYSTSEVAIMPVSIISSTSGISRPRFSAVSTIVTTMG